MKKRLNIIHEDAAIVVVEKAAGVLTIPDRFKPEVFNLYDHLKKANGDIFTVHRLDKETSGILVFAKTKEAHRSLSQQFEERTVEKIYLVLVEGVLFEKTGEIDKPIGYHPSKAGQMMVTRKGKPSLTLFRALEYFKNFTLVEADIKTGRTHQIRVHFQSVGYPLAIDAMYGGKEGFYLSTVKRKYNLGKNAEERPLMSRTSLHAKKLVLDHPETGERMTFESELPKDFSAVLKQLRKWGK
ncbi:MAG: RluA family pseudouridine synthase [Bacteroidota bacterium]